MRADEVKPGDKVFFGGKWCHVVVVGTMTVNIADDEGRISAVLNLDELRSDATGLVVQGIAAPKADVVNHPPHYTAHPSGIEVIVLTEHMNFCLGNVVKYVLRAGHKTDDPIVDLKKARWYLDREIARLEKPSLAERVTKGEKP